MPYNPDVYILYLCMPTCKSDQWSIWLS